MTALDLVAAPAVAPHAAHRSRGIDLAARVGAARVAQAMQDSPDRQVLFMIVGLSKRLTCAVARQIRQDIPGVTVEVDEDMADDLLPSGMISRRAIADYRNSPRDTGGGAIVFAPSPRELDDVGKTSGDIQQVSEQVLMAMPELWLDCSPELAGLGARDRQNVINVLHGIAGAQILTTGLEMFGEFIWRVDHAYASMEIERALDQALPALRIPLGAGRFKKLAIRGRLTSVHAWTERFRDLQSLADDALNLRREGSPLNRVALRCRLQELTDEAAVSDDERDVLAALIDDDRIEPGMWRQTQTAASELRWVAVERLVKTSKRKVQQPLGEATIALFREKMPNDLGDDDRAILEAMVADADSADDEERAFFFRQRTNIADASKGILKRWEQYVLKKTEQHSDCS